MIFTSKIWWVALSVTNFQSTAVERNAQIEKNEKVTDKMKVCGNTSCHGAWRDGDNGNANLKFDPGQQLECIDMDRS